MQNVKNITTDVMDEMEELEKKNQEKPKTNNAFDAKNYLNVKLDTSKGELQKEMRIRILPISSTDSHPKKIIHMHTLKVDKAISPSGWKSYVCLEKTDEIDHERFGNKCPFCEVNRDAYKKSTEAKNDVDKKLWQKLSLENIPSEVVILRVIERGHEDDGPKFWKFNKRKDGQDPWSKIYDLYKSRLQESREEGDDELNILDIYTGKDLKVTISAVYDSEGKLSNKTKIDIVDYGKQKPLAGTIDEPNEELINKWVNDSKVWSDVFVTKPYDYLSIIIDGKIPYFDKANNKWVPKEDNDVVKSKDEADVDNDIKAAQAKATRIDVQEEQDDDIPF